MKLETKERRLSGRKATVLLMKPKRCILSLLLALTLLLTALPMTLLPAEATASSRESAADYNDLYVSDGLILGMDFYALNAIWDPEGEALSAAITALGDGSSAREYRTPENSWFDFYRYTGSSVIPYCESGSGASFTVEAGHLSMVPRDNYTSPYLGFYGTAVTGLRDSFAVEMVFRPNITGIYSLSFNGVGIQTYTSKSTPDLVTFVRPRVAHSATNLTEASWATSPAIKTSEIHTLSYYAEKTGENAYDYALSLNGAGYEVLSGTPSTETLTWINYPNQYNSDMDLYGLRLYEDTLTEDEREQNHFADLAKYYQLDLTDFDKILSATDKKTVYAALAGYTLVSDETIFTAKETIQGALDTAVAPLVPEDFVIPGVPEGVMPEDYNALYVKEGLLMGLDFFALNSYWDPEGEAMTAAAEAFGDGSSTREYLKMEDNWFYSYLYEGSSVFPFSNNGTGAAFTLHAGYITMVPRSSNNAPYLEFRGEAVQAVRDEFAVEMAFRPNTIGLYSFNFNGVGWQSWAPAAGSITFVRPKEGGTNTNLSADPWAGYASHPMNTAEMNTMSYYAKKTGEGTYDYGMGINGAGYDVVSGTPSTKTGTWINHPTQYTTDMDLYALRFYDHALTEDERAQNHFADMAKYFRLNLIVDSFLGFSEAQRKEIYASLAGITFASSRDDAQLAYLEVLSTMPYEILALCDFDGYAVRLSSGAPGIRGVFAFDMDAVIAYAEKHGVSVELGVRVTGDATVEKSAVLVSADGTVSADSRYYEAESEGEPCYYVLALLYREGADGTAMEEMEKEARKAMLEKEVTYQGYLRFTAAGEAPTEHLIDMTSSFGASVSASEVYTRFAESEPYGNDALVQRVLEWLS